MPDAPELRRQIEDLALRLVVGDSAAVAEWIPAIEEIRDLAMHTTLTHVSASAQAVIDRLRACPERDALTTLGDGIGELQQAMDAPSEPGDPGIPLAQDPELLSDFILESREHLAEIEAQVLVIERDPRDSEALNAVFRGFHTIKGLAGFLELWEVQHLSHEIETVLDRARNSQLTMTPSAIDVILQGADYLRRWITHVESSLHRLPSIEPHPDESLRQRIKALAGDGSAPRPPESLPQLAAALASPVPPATPSLPVPEPAVVEDPPPVEEVQASASTQPAGKRGEAMAVKVDTAKLDYLVDMAGELVIAESLVRHDAEIGALKSPGLQRKIAQLARITAELQKTAMAIRLVPIGPLFRRMARLVRDLARQFGKQVELETQGDDVELDRTIVEELADPLMHMVRNALDHGIERPEERAASGKTPVARLFLKANHQAGQVVIEISEDGRGLDHERIRAKAIDRGLITASEVLTDAEVHNLIFLPGFSTASEVTNVSGRGVGMDVVRRHIEKLRGRVEIRSQAGQGSTFLLKLPLTLAIIDGLVVGVGQERYIVPLFAVREMFRPGEGALWTVQQRGEMALVRGSLLPVLRLHRRFAVPPRSEDPMQGVLVVIEIEGQRFCLLVDELIGKQEVVIKTLGELFQNVPGVAGGAILGDGRVGLILDLERLFREKSDETTH